MEGVEAGLLYMWLWQSALKLRWLFSANDISPNPFAHTEKHTF